MIAPGASVLLGATPRVEAMASWMVTGGAGYIGAHVVRAFLDQGITPIVVDDLSSGRREFVPEGVTFVEASILDRAGLDAALAAHPVDGIVHVAGYKYAGVSVQRPFHTYQQNVTGMVTVLEAAQAAGVDKIVFSSSASVYGTPDTELVTEDSPLHPESPYGQTKLIGEWLLKDAEVAHPGTKTVALRYFNVVGSATDEVYDASPHNLFPIVIEALLAGKTPRINGDDYATADGTCVRDYVHVGDLAISHVAAAQALMEGRELLPAYNLGSGEGLSVRQIMDAVARVTGRAFTPEMGPRRPGDPARIVADGTAAARDLDWQMRHSVDDMVASAWSARLAHQA